MTVPGASAVTLIVTAGGVKEEPPLMGPGMVSTTSDPTRATEGAPPGTLPPEILVDTNVEFAGTGMSIFRLLMFWTVNPDAEDGTDEAPGVRVMASGEPAVTEPDGAVVPSTDVVILDV
ncbi:hypothetical protein [Mycobacterium sp. MS1601]|uniref:hypothetical protein n=1 Tax=Mycobacterium sp. MS1601 TaxID=1936029 RepID=UPI0012FB07C7|nr:hypothetical protein [Mycobacterium sp. MS1601]